ncbi:MAG TPA: 4-(cytidine 5'-diphospho)-2-C-methyl-D-erythritol kinase [Nitrospirota bacterium]
MNLSVAIKAPAKVNLLLRVIGKRPDGYHELQSIMQALELADELTLERIPGPGITLTCDSPEVPLGPANLVWKAADAVMREAGIAEGVRIHLVKNTPTAAGMGGGSSDAAATLKGMVLLFGLDIPDARLRQIALGLGADVPFFLSWPCAMAEGVGEVLTELSPPDETFIVAVNPGFPVSTGWVFSSLTFELTNTYNGIRLSHSGGLSGKDARTVAPYLRNDLERVTAVKYPQINEIKGRLVEFGAFGALMSGSGPTVFGVFGSEQEAESAARRIARPDWKVIVTRTISSWPVPTVLTG